MLCRVSYYTISNMGPLYISSSRWRHQMEIVSVLLPQWRLKSSASRLFAQAQIKETSKLRVTGLCGGKPPLPGGFPSQRASDAENVSIWWRYHNGKMSVFRCRWRKYLKLRKAMNEIDQTTTKPNKAWAVYIILAYDIRGKGLTCHTQSQQMLKRIPTVSDMLFQNV